MNIKNFVPNDHIMSTNETMQIQSIAIQAYLLENEQLQQEIKEANDSITWWSNRFKAVQKENKRLKEANKVLEENEMMRKLIDEGVENSYKKLKYLQQENERLKQNQVKALNRIRDFINLCKCEITEGSYSNDKHSQYWSMFKRFAEELQDKIKDIDTNDYVYIPKWREQELLSQEEQLEDYKSRCEKASDKIQYIIDYGFDYDGFNTVESLKGLIDMLVDYARESKNILQNGSDDNEL